MNLSKLAVSLALILIGSICLTACGGGKSTPPPPPGAPTILTTELPQGAVNTAYGNTGAGVAMSASGGTSPYTWSIASGSLPPGMSLTSGTQGVISGTPTTLGNYAFTAKVTDSAGLSGTQNLSIYIEGVVSITPTALPSGSAGVNYTVQLTATGGLPPYNWSVASGSLPAGLTLDPNAGVISGVPTANGPPTTFTIQVSDSETAPGLPAVGSAMFTITIMSITTTSLPAGYLGTPYSVQLMVAGGSSPYTWAATNLPPGLFLDPTTCIGTKLQTCTIKGTPTQAGSQAVALMVTDGEKVNPASAGVTLSISIYQSQLTISGSLSPGTEGVPYNSSLTASGGVAPYTWTVTNGALPTGLSLDPKTCTNSSSPCIISGTPTTVGPFNFTMQVTDSGSPPQPVSAPFSILISFSPLGITTTSLPSGLVNVPYSTTLVASGGVSPYTWCIVESDGVTCDNGAGILPAGLTLNQSTGVISGTPSATGTSSFNVQVQDSGTPQQTVRTGSPLSVVITSLGNNTLKGNYIFNFSGYNNGALAMMAGSFVADGNGNLTSGVLDYNDGNGEPVDSNGRPIPQNLVSGSKYSINPDGSGTMTMVTDLPTTFNFAIAVRSDGSGNLIQSDPANPQAYGSGAIMGTTPLGGGEQWPLCGSPVALGLYGLNPTQTARYAAAGQFQYDPHTCVDAENGTLDIDNGGSPSSATFSGAFNEYDRASSRGILGVTYNSDPSARYFNPFYLILSSDRKQKKLIFVTENVCDTKLNCPPTGPTLWSALPQANPPAGWNNANLNGTAVAELNALDTTSAADVTAGLFVGNGSSSNNCQNGNYDTATFSFDENQGGVLLSQQQQTNIKYCVNQTTARVTVCYLDQGGNCVGTPPVFYLVKSNQGFVVGTDPAVTSGYLEQQTGSPFADASVFGLYAGSTINPITSMVTNSVSTFFADGEGNIVNGNESSSGPGGPKQQNFTYTYAVDSTGRTLVCASGTCTAQSNNIIGVAYVVSPTKFVLLPATDPNPALSIFGE